MCKACHFATDLPEQLQVSHMKNKFIVVCETFMFWHIYRQIYANIYGTELTAILCVMSNLQVCSSAQLQLCDDWDAGHI